MTTNGFSRRTFLKFAAGSAGVALLAACAPAATSGTTAPAAGDQAAQSAAPAAEGGSGVLWGLQYDPHVETYHRLADLFKKQTGATLSVEPQDWPLETKLIAALSAGTQPDVLCIMGKVLPPLHIQKALMPLSDTVYAAQGVDPATSFIGDGIGAYTWQGELYGVPTEVNGVGNVVNVPVDDVKTAGLDKDYPPTNGEPWFASYESMWDLAKALQVEENGQVTRWGLSSKGWANQSYLGIVRTLLKPEGTDWWDVNAAKFNLDSEAGVKAMELFVETPVKMGIETELDQNQIDAALAGKVALARGNGTPAVQGRDLGYNFFLAGVPKINGDEPPQLVGEAGWGFAAPKNAKNVDIAVNFLKMMATQEGQKNYAMIYGGIVSAWKGLAGDFSYYKDSSDDSPNVAAAKLAMDHLLAQTQFYGEGFGLPSAVDGIGEEVCSKVRVGDMTAAEGAKEYQTRCEAQYKQYLEDLAAAA